MVNKRKSKASKPRRKVVWNARVLMAKNHIRSVTALTRCLEEVGVEISISALGRLIDGKTPYWNQSVIEGLLMVFDCEIADLLTVEADEASHR